MSIFGRVYRVTTFGQSHARAVGCVIDGFPGGFSLCLHSIQAELNRRRPGQSLLSTPRDEKDQVECLSGMEQGKTLGSPLCFIVKNQDVVKTDYAVFQDVPRPGHADFTYLKKYGIKAESGGGRSSARETIGRVIAGAVAQQYLSHLGIGFVSWVHSVKNIAIPSQINQQLIAKKLTSSDIERLGLLLKHKNKFMSFSENPKLFEGEQPGREVANMRCPHFETACSIFEAIKQAKSEKDSLGGTIQGCIYGLPIGLGEPVFEKVQATIGGLMLSIPAVKGFEFGSGFEGTKMYGSEHNDMFKEDLQLETNNCGGSLGGITTGSPFTYRVAFKPVSTIGKPQMTASFSGQTVKLEGKGRHDPCVLPRATAIVDSCAAMAVMDLILQQKRLSTPEQSMI